MHIMPQQFPILISSFGMYFTHNWWMKSLLGILTCSLETSLFLLVPLIFMVWFHNHTTLSRVKGVGGVNILSNLLLRHPCADTSKYSYPLYFSIWRDADFLSAEAKVFTLNICGGGATLAAYQLIHAVI